MNEQELIRLANDGDDSQISALIYFHKPAVLAYILCHFPNAGKQQLLDDIYQDVCLAFYRSLPVDQRYSSVKGLMMRLARNAVANHFRMQGRAKRGRNVTVSQNQFVDNELINVLEHVSDESRTPSCVVRSAEIAQLVRDAIERLTSHVHRTIVQLKYFEGYSDAEVCEVLDISKGAMRGQKYRAVKKLRGLLGLSSY